jgi:hypothetical protein
MLSLNTNIPISYIKKDKRLQGVETELKWCIPLNGGERNYDKAEILDPKKDCFAKHYFPKFLPAPTLADIIDNAEELFYNFHTNYRNAVQIVINMCQQDKSIDEISEYIISNLK